MILKGYVFASIMMEINGNCSNFTQYTTFLQDISQSKLSDTIEKVLDYCSNFQYMQKMCYTSDDEWDVDHENMILFMQHGLVLHIFDQVVWTGDSGLMCSVMSFFTIWLQSTGSDNYKYGLLRLTTHNMVGWIA